MPGAILNRVRRWLYGRDFAVWHHPAYRLPFTHLHARTGFEPQRADYALWYLLKRRAIGRRNLRAPRRAEYAELLRVHSPDLLDSLSRPEALARVWSVDAGDVPVDAVMTSVRLACGATIDAARELVRPQPHRVARRAMNLFGGFHHAAPGAAGGFCPVNDVAVAIAAVRSEGFRGRVAILDLDAHPPDGTARCLENDPACWIGSLSAGDWGPLPGRVDETVLPVDARDVEYLGALDGLLARMPRDAELAFVIAGGDILQGDPLGRLRVSVAGCRERDLRVAHALFRVPSVWLPGGGYTPQAWRVLAGTGLALAVHSRAEIPEGYDPLLARYSAIARSLAPEDLGPPATSEDELMEALGLAGPRRKLLLGFYSSEGLEHALERYGFLEQLRRLGYGPFRVLLSEEGIGHSARLVDVPTGEALIELVLEKKRVAGTDALYVHWLALRHPRARFSAQRPQLPGQDVPGLGMAKEISALLLRMAKRLGLDAIALRPSAYHNAVRGRDVLRFVDPERQGRFEALMRDLSGVPLADATKAVADGRVLLDGKPYLWEADEMVQRRSPEDDREAIEREKERARFTLAPARTEAR